MVTETAICLQNVLTTSQTVECAKVEEKNLQTDSQPLEATFQEVDSENLEEKDLLKVSRQLGSNW
uniref:Uncharacterized protein n=1 Tax=Octopus bimaculoides TaxID=37653 RepID=A0A0L8FQZ8_OCTBM